MSGASGVVAAVTVVAVEGGPSPRWFVDTTTQSYESPFTSDPTTMGELAPLAVLSPSTEEHVTVLSMITSPPVLPGVNATLTELLPRVALVMLGCPGRTAAGLASDAFDAGLLPIELLATTLHVYVLAFDRFVTVIGESPPDFVRVMPPLLDVHVTR